MKLIYYPNPILSAPCRDVTGEELETGKIGNWSIPDLAGQMSTMMKKRNGCGLAAPQVGLSVRMFVWSDPTGRIESAINPVLEELKGGDFNSEGCLSIPGVHGYVKRFERLILIGNDPYDPKSRFSTKIRDRWIARIVQHEFDHLDGKLFFERFDDKDKQINERALQALRECWLAGKEPLEKRKEVDVGNRSS